MSQSIILEYAGLPVHFHHGRPDFVAEEQADKFLSETEALEAARQNNLNQKHCRAVDLNIRNAQGRMNVTPFTYWTNKADNRRYKVLWVDADGIVAHEYSFEQSWFGPKEDFLNQFLPIK